MACRLSYSVDCSIPVQKLYASCFTPQYSTNIAYNYNSTRDIHFASAAPQYWTPSVEFEYLYCLIYQPESELFTGDRSKDSHSPALHLQNKPPTPTFLKKIIWNFSPTLNLKKVCFLNLKLNQNLILKYWETVRK